MRGGHKYISSHSRLVFQRKYLLCSKDFQGGQWNFCKNSIVPLENPKEASEKDAMIPRFSRFAATKLVMPTPLL